MDHLKKWLMFSLLILLQGGFPSISYGISPSLETIAKGLMFLKEPPLRAILIPERYLDDKHVHLLSDSEFDKKDVYVDYLAGWQGLQPLLMDEMALIAEEKETEITFEQILKIHCNILPKYCQHWLHDGSRPPEQQFVSRTSMLSYPMRLELLTPDRLKEMIELFKSVFLEEGEIDFLLSIRLDDYFKLADTREDAVASVLLKVFNSMPPDQWSNTLAAYSDIDLFCDLKKGIRQTDLEKKNSQEHLRKLAVISDLCVVDSANRSIPDDISLTVHLDYPSATVFEKIIYLYEEITRANEALKEARNNDEVISVVAEMTRRLIAIHPFYDGNGRTIRMFANYALIRYGLAPTAFTDFSPLPKTSAEWQVMFKEAQEKGAALLSE